jgi:hypothetical protein
MGVGLANVARFTKSAVSTAATRPKPAALAKMTPMVVLAALQALTAFATFAKSQGHDMPEALQ